MQINPNPLFQLHSIQQRKSLKLPHIAVLESPQSFPITRANISCLTTGAIISSSPWPHRCENLVVTKRAFCIALLPLPSVFSLKGQALKGFRLLFCPEEALLFSRIDVCPVILLSAADPRRSRSLGIIYKRSFKWFGSLRTQALALYPNFAGGIFLLCR